MLCGMTIRSLSLKMENKVDEQVVSLVDTHCDYGLVPIVILSTSSYVGSYMTMGLTIYEKKLMYLRYLYVG